MPNIDLRVQSLEFYDRSGSNKMISFYGKMICPRPAARRRRPSTITTMLGPLTTIFDAEPCFFVLGVVFAGLAAVSALGGGAAVLSQ